MLKELHIESHLVVSKAGQLTREYETELTVAQLRALASFYYSCNDIAAPIASGSFKTMGMIIAPCSMKTLGEIAHGIGNNLLTRAADVVLKERRRLVLVPRESPLHAIHLQNMLTITQSGGVICPPAPAFYHKPNSIDDLINDHIARILDLYQIEHPSLKRWKEPAE